MPDAIDTLLSEVAADLHAEKKQIAAQRVSDFCELGLKIDSDNPVVCDPPLQHILHWALDDGRPVQAAQMLWRPNLFNPNPQCSKDIWNLFDTAAFGLLMGSASMSKSYGMGARVFLEWIRDPQWTCVKVIGPSEEHLESNLFSHLVSLHQSASLPMPGEIGDLFIGLNRRDRLSSISGVVIPVGKIKKAGRLQGVKRKPRPEAHPIFGPLSRLFVFIDEIENVPAGLWSDIDNVMANYDETDSGGLKIFGAYNPTNPTDEVGKRAEPQFGWESFDLDNHFRWTSKRGWEVLRLDAERSENVVAGKTIYPGLQTRQGLEKIARNAGGTNSPGYYSMGRGAYPPMGIEMTVIPAGMLNKMRGTYIWLGEPIPVGSCDLALEGGAAAVFTKGLWGQATGIKYPPSLEFPAGRTVMFHGPNGRVNPQWGLQADAQFILPKGDTVAMKDRVIETCRKAGVRPEYFGIDRTGIGAGVADLMKHEWSASIKDVNYSESTTKLKVTMEDTQTADEAYDRIHSELWFAMRTWAEFRYLLLNPQLDLEKLSQQLTNRRFKTLNRKNKVESKKDYRLRGFTSPDEADSLSLMVHAVRLASSVVPSMTGDSGISSDDEGWYSQKTRIDVSNRFDFLQE